MKNGEAVGAFQGARLRAFGPAFVSITMGLAFARLRANCFVALRVLKSSTICRENIDDSSFLTKAFRGCRFDVAFVVSFDVVSTCFQVTSLFAHRFTGRGDVFGARFGTGL